MTATYSGDPSYSSKDAVRFLIRDTDMTSPHIQDEEITWLLSENNGNVYAAAIQTAEQVATSYASQSGTGQVKSKTVGALSLSYTDLAKEYRTIALDLRRRHLMGAGTGGIQPYAGGISVADKDVNAADTDWDKPAFVRKIHDYPHAETWREELTDWPSS